MAWHKVRNEYSKLTLLGVTLLILTGLGSVFYYTYHSLRRDMNLITAKQKNVFDVFYQRAKILEVENMVRYADLHLGQDIPAPVNGLDTDYLYGFDLKTQQRFADIPLQYPAANLLNTFRYALSYPEVNNIYTLWNDYRLIGMVADNNVLPAKLASIETDLMAQPAWYHYFGCADFAPNRTFCSADEAFVSDIEIDSFSMRNTIVMYFPFIHQSGLGSYKYGLLGINISVDEAFRDVLLPFTNINPTRAAVSFNVAEPCRPFHLCLKKSLMRTKAGTDLYLKWSYSWLDFIKLTLHSAAFEIYLIALLLLMVTWKQLYLRLRTLAHTDHLTRLPRRDILNQRLLHEHDYLMILDIDNFKSINDLHGHSIGDAALTAFARYLKGNIRKLDTAIRWGGEEFIVLFRGMGNDDMMSQSAKRLLTRPLQIPELPDPITFSAGVIRIRDYLTVTEAVHLADELLYHVKQHGKHNIACYEGTTIRLIRPLPDEAESA
ncbi:GGDEF domain-containing protein [Aeromonas sp. HMWF014]|uniref:GGDEF domain-containing protein n=2 Tax=Aeromonas TaxID=642 RepID=UPI000D389A61|nr:GGDEF domain-containing protein [Aeromonas sp. HMWF014]PTT55134.1 GGDEF domain-containing protein [Aeromonas sp. HMWF014]